MEDVIVFDSIKHVDDEGKEYWLARELMPLLEYTEWRKFTGVINRAIINCTCSNYNVFDHFVGTAKMVCIGSNTKRKLLDYKLSRYACYLIVLNCDPRKKVIALAKTYFAVQTRRQELREKEYIMLTEEEKSLKELEKEKKVSYE